MTCLAKEEEEEKSCEKRCRTWYSNTSSTETRP